MLPFQLKRSLLYLCFIAPKLRNNRLHNSLYKAIHDISSQDKCFTYNIVLTSYGAQLISILCLVRYSIMRKMSRIDLRLFHQVSMSLSVRYNYNYPFEFVIRGIMGATDLHLRMARQPTTRQDPWAPGIPVPELESSVAITISN